MFVGVLIFGFPQGSVLWAVLFTIKLCNLFLFKRNIDHYRDDNLGLGRDVSSTIETTGKRIWLIVSVIQWKSYEGQWRKVLHYQPMKTYLGIDQMQNKESTNFKDQIGRIY